MLLSHLLLTAAPSVIAATPTDVDGWEGLEWGASVGELAEHLGRFPTASFGELSELGCDERLSEQAVTHLDFQFDLADFCFEEGRLVEVLLTAYGPEPTREAVRNKLEDEYGPAMYASDGESGFSADPHRPVGSPPPPFQVWQFESTRIWHMGDNNVTVVYSPIGADPALDADIEALLKEKDGNGE